MKIEQFHFQIGEGWSIPAFPELDSDRTLVLIFAAPELCSYRKPFEDLKLHYSRSHIIGCSTAGEILGSELRDMSLSVSVIQFEETNIQTVSTSITTTEDSYRAARIIAEQLDAPDLRAVFVLSDGLHVNGSQLVRGLSNAFPDHVVVSGGLAADGPHFGQTYVIRSGLPTTEVIVAVGLYGNKLKVSATTEHGWSKFGHERVITQSQDNVLFALDDMPALDIYKEYLGEKAAELPSSALLFPLSVWDPHSSKSPHLIRTILGIDEKTKSMTFAGDVPQGSSVQFLYGNYDRLICGAGAAARKAIEQPHQDAFAISISCVGRRLFLMDRTEEEIENVLDNLPPGTKLGGFYSYGEIAPQGEGSSQLHNQSMTLTLLSEAA